MYNLLTGKIRVIYSIKYRVAKKFVAGTLVLNRIKEMKFYQHNLSQWFPQGSKNQFLQNEFFNE